MIFWEGTNECRGEKCFYKTRARVYIRSRIVTTVIIILDTFPQSDIECALLFSFYDIKCRCHDYIIIYILFVGHYIVIAY